MRDSIRELTDKEKEQYDARLRVLVGEGKSAKECAVVLRDELNVASTFETVAYRARVLGISFISKKKVRQSSVVAEEKLDEVVEKDRKIRLLEDEVNGLKQRYQHTLREETLGERIIAGTVPQIKALKAATPPIYLPDGNGVHSPQEAVCFISCLHLDEVVSEDETMGLGNYSPALAGARFQYYIDSVIDLLKVHHKNERIDRVTLVDVGDNGSGAIHEELRATNASPLGSQMVRAAHLLAAGVRDLAANFAEVEFVGTVGNHMRFDKKPAFKDKVGNNGDYVIYRMMEALLADQTNVTMTIPLSPWATKTIQGHEFFFTHGDAIKMYFAFPWYDAKRYTSEMTQLLKAGGNPIPKYWGFGHFHQYNISQLSYGEWLFTGSSKGPDEYSIGRLRAGVPPNWLLFGVHPRRGLSFRYPIILSDADPEEQTRYQDIVKTTSRR
jgi:hypothetical protein